MVQGRFPSFRRLLTGTALLFVAVGLSGCDTIGKKGEDMACPDIRVDRDTASLTRFREGPGRDITDITLQGKIAAVNGECGWDPQTRTVDVTMKVLFEVSRGPAMRGHDGSLTYFVAIPSFYPDEHAKQILPVSFTFPDGTINTMLIRDDEVRITLPLEDGETSKDHPLYVGFQLTPKDLSYNRKPRT